MDVQVLVLVMGTLLMAGVVKGVIGLGLPTVSLALLTLALDLPTAMALVVVPSFLTNVWQAAVGGNGGRIFRRLWPFLLMAGATVWIGVHALARTGPLMPTVLLGALLVVYGLVNLAGLQPAMPARYARYERWAGVVVGSTNGVLTGMTGSSVVPGVMFLQAIGLPRDMLVQAMGLLFTVSTMALGVALLQVGILGGEYGLMSAIAVVPAVIGMVLGRKIRLRLSAQRFRTLFFISLLALGGYIIVNALRTVG